MLKSDHIEIEMDVDYHGLVPEVMLKSDHIEIEIITPPIMYY